MKKAAPRKGLFGRIRGEAAHLEELVKKIAQRAPAFLANAGAHIKKFGAEHVRPDLAKGIRVIAKALDDVSSSIAPEGAPRGRKKKARKKAGSSRRAAAGGAGRKKSRSRQKARR